MYVSSLMFSVKVLIHLFTDGVDHGSLAEDVAKYQTTVDVQGVEGLRQSFLYSFDTSFDQSSALAKDLHSNLVMIHESEQNLALEERERERERRECERTRMPVGSLESE